MSKPEEVDIVERSSGFWLVTDSGVVDDEVYSRPYETYAKADRARTEMLSAPVAFHVDWSKTYEATGSVEIMARSRTEARRIALDNIGNYEGSMQCTDNDRIENVSLKEPAGGRPIQLEDPRLLAGMVPELVGALESVLAATCGDVGDDGYEGCIRVENRALDAARSLVTRMKDEHHVTGGPE